MSARLQYVINYVADMDAAIQFYRDRFGMQVRFQSPDWTELVTGDTTLALHRADEKKPAGTVQIGIRVPDMQAFYAEMTAAGFRFTQPPTMMHGTMLARFVDAHGQEFSVSGA